MCEYVFINIKSIWDLQFMQRLLAWEKKISQEKFNAYFKKKSKSKDETDGIQINNVLTSVTEKITSVALV